MTDHAASIQALVAYTHYWHRWSRALVGGSSDALHRLDDSRPCGPCPCQYAPTVSNIATHRARNLRRCLATSPGSGLRPHVERANASEACSWYCATRRQRCSPRSRDCSHRHPQFHPIYSFSALAACFQACHPRCSSWRVREATWPAA